MFESYVIKMAEIISAIFFVKVYNIYKGDFTMAKIAKCGYGSRGEGLGKTTDGYTYVVNDNVRTGDIIQVISTSRKGKKFATTAVPLHAYQENSKKGQMAVQQAQEKTGENPIKSYSGKEVGATGSRTVPKTPAIGGEKPQSQYTMQTRAGNISQYMQSHPDAKLTKHAQETFDSYSKPFMKGEQQ